MKCKKVLVCGGTGFIGRNVLEHFSSKQGFTIVATHLNRRPPKHYDNVTWVKCDLRDPVQVKKIMNGIDVVLQFAATTSGAKDIITTPHMHVTDNAVMNSLLLSEAYENCVEHFLFPSCTTMYQKSEKALKETDFNPSDEILPFYFGSGHTKVYLENMCKFYAGLGKTKFTVIRHSNIYGPYDKYDLERSHVFGATVTKIMNSSDGKVRVWGSGEESRDLLFVEDFLEFIDAVIEKQEKNFELYNVGLGKATKIKNLVSRMIQLSNKVLEIEYDLSQPTIPTSLYLDCGKAQKDLGWKPRHSLDEGIKKTLSWYRKEIQNDKN
jgi:nucleoside-diphosphate-sugar epimerase